MILCAGALPFVWKLSGRITGHFGYGVEYEVIETHDVLVLSIAILGICLGIF